MRTFLTFIFLFFSLTAVNAQATARFTASATIIQPIGITTISNLNFADIDAKGGGDVILIPDEVRVTAGSSSLANGTSASAAEFLVTGEQGFAFSLSLPKSTYLLTNGSENMRIKDFTSSFGAGALTSDQVSFKVGATLEVNPHQAPGIYLTPVPLEVMVNYN